ncbi:unnamed protein product, partial [Nesidiocoris tenuis]
EHFDRAVEVGADEDVSGRRVHAGRVSFDFCDLTHDDVRIRRENGARHHCIVHFDACKVRKSEGESVNSWKLLKSCGLLQQLEAYCQGNPIKKCQRS